MKCLIDADIICYSVGFASEAHIYEVRGKPFSGISFAKQFCKDNDIGIEEIIDVVTPEPIEHCLHSCKQLINRILEVTEADEYQLYLTGPGNFRVDLATIAPYKGTRPSRRPVHYEAIIKYLTDVWGAETVLGYEADDALATAQTPDTIICTLDKDLDMVPGLHYNWRKDVLYFITPKEGMRNFYTQLLTGDQVDNIKGVPLIGGVKAAKILDKASDEEEHYWRCLEAYEKKYERPYEALMENAHLLWMQVEEGKRWVAPA